MNQELLKDLLKKYNLKPNFTYGQNFLVDETVLEDIANSANLSPEDVVLEIGPGIGNLTKLLCERAGFILSVEKDPKFQSILYKIKKDFPNNFRFEIADALEFDYCKAIQEGRGGRVHSGEYHPSPLTVHPYKVVANIPYYITGKILQMFMTAKNKPELITVLTQKEVAERVVAKAGDLSVLAISVQLYGEPKIIRMVPKTSFYPAPKVDSAILQIDLNKKIKYQVADEKVFFRVVRACFAGKRKQLHNTLVNNLRLDKTSVNEILGELSINPTVRPQALSIEQWVALTEKINSKSLNSKQSTNDLKA